MRKLLVLGVVLVMGLVVSVPSALAGSFEMGDANFDLKIDDADLVIWKTYYNKVDARGNFNNTGKVDGIDYVIWLNHYGQTVTPTPTPNVVTSNSCTNGYQWALARYDQSCTSACGEIGGSCAPGNWNDDSSCSIANGLLGKTGYGKCNTCSNNENVAWAPYYGDVQGAAYCKYRPSGTAIGSCDQKTTAGSRLCACITSLCPAVTNTPTPIPTTVPPTATPTTFVCPAGYTCGTSISCAGGYQPSSLAESCGTNKHCFTCVAVPTPTLPPVACDSFIDMHFNSCDSTAKYSSGSEDCKTYTDSVSLKFNNQKLVGSQVKLYTPTASEDATFCSQFDDSKFSTTLSGGNLTTTTNVLWTLTGESPASDPGKKRLCALLTRDGSFAKCGTAIRLVPTPTPVNP